MTTLQEAARKALACLELYYHEDLARCEARHELRTALAQQGEQQPVCHGCGIPAGDVHMSTCKSGKWPSRVSNGDTAAPAPQAQQGEHVAWAIYDKRGGSKSLHWAEQHTDGNAEMYNAVPLYKAAPAPQAQHSQYGSEDLQALILAKLTAPQAQEPARNVTKEEDAILRGALLRSGTVIHPKPAPQPAQGVGRTNDPVTSKGKRKINKYEEEVLAQLSMIGPSTGKEIAALSQQPLNCITPHFATLRRKGLIKDIGVRRDKQIVWVLA